MTDQFALSQNIGLTQIAPEIDFRGKTIVITGGADGIGRAVAEAAHYFGAHVIAIDIQKDKLADLENKLGGERITTLPFDLSTQSDAAYQTLVKQIEQAAPNGVVDTYLINAGIIKKYNDKASEAIATRPLDEADLLYAVNVRSHIAIYQHLLPLLKKSDTPRIVLTSSPIVGRNEPKTLNYAWTKATLENTVAGMAVELNNQVQVTGYVPPPVQVWLRADHDNEPIYANPQPVDVIELPLRLMSPALKAKHHGKIFTFVDKRTKNIQPANDGTPYSANDRTDNGFNLGIRTRPIGKGGGTEGDAFIDSYDTWNARQIIGAPPVPPIDETIRLKDIHKPPAHIRTK